MRNIISYYIKQLLFGIMIEKFCANFKLKLKNDEEGIRQKLSQKSLNWHEIIKHNAVV